MNRRGSASRRQTSCRSSTCGRQLAFRSEQRLRGGLTLLQCRGEYLQTHRAHASTFRRAGLGGCGCGRRWPVRVGSVQSSNGIEVTRIMDDRSQQTYPVDKVGDSLHTTRHGCCRRSDTRVGGILHKDSHKHQSSSSKEHNRESRSHTESLFNNQQRLATQQVEVSRKQHRSRITWERYFMSRPNC